WTAACDARNTGQGINPSSRPIGQADQDCAHNNMLEFITPVCEVAKDGIAILANSAGNGVLNKIKLTDIGNIFSCAQRADGTKIADTWEKIPGSDPSLAGLDIIKYTRDGVSGTTDVFTSRTHGLVEGTVTNFPGVGSPPDVLYWRHHPEFFHSSSCVRDILGDGATQVIGYSVANDPQAIGFAGLPALQEGNYALRVCDDVNNPCANDSDFIGPSIATIEDGTYYYARTLYLGRVQGFPDPTSYTLPDSQDQFHTAACGAASCDFLAPHVSAAGFFPAPRCFTP